MQQIQKIKKKEISGGEAKSEDKKSASKSTEKTNEKSSEKKVMENEAFAREEKPFVKMEFIQSLSDALETSPVIEVLPFFDKVPEEYQKDYDIRYLKAALSLSAGKADEAKVICDGLLLEYPKDNDILELSAEIAKARGDRTTKQAALKKILADDPYNEAANVSQGNEYIYLKKYKTAQTSFTKALKSNPKSQEALLGMGMTSYYLEKDDEAKEWLNKLIEVNPENAMAYLYLGKLAHANNKYKVAFDNASKAVELDSENYDAWMDLGTYERYLGHYDKAEEAWTRAIKLNPNYFLAYAYRAGLYDERNMCAKALKDYSTVVTLNPDYYYAYESMGVLALHEKDYEKARQAFLKCREKNTSNISYPLLITYCYYMEGNKVEAKKYSDSVLRKLDRSTIEYSMLRVFHDEAGEMTLPQKISSIENANTKGKMYFYLGLFYDMFGGSQYAKEYYSKVLKMNSPMFFEYRLAEWGMESTKDE